MRLRHTPWHACGFTLIETLVSIVILCVGVLGVVGLQVAAIKSNREARYQSVGVQLARELSDMVLGNRAVGALTNDNPYIGAFQTTAGGVTRLIAPDPAYCLSVRATVACADARELAKAEITEWLAHVQDELPGARVDTCFDAAPYDTDGVPKWACTAASGAPFVIKIGWTRSALDKSLTGAAALEYAAVPAVVVALAP